MKTHSTKAMLSRRYGIDVRKLKQWCFDNQASWYSFSNAPAYSICVLSTYEYDLGEQRESLDTDNDSYFIDWELYPKWEEEH